MEVDEATVGSPLSDVDAVRFVLVNFPRYLGQKVGGEMWHGRLDVHLDAFRLVLDSASGRNATADAEPPHYGYAATHVGLLTRVDGGRFSVSDVELHLRSLWYLLSLMRGAYTSPVSWIGECDGQPVWTRHVGWHLDPWHHGEFGVFPTGFVAFEDEAVVPALERAFLRAQELLQDADWRDVLMTSLHWYISANTGHSTGDLVLAQAGLELLAYAHQVLAGRLSPTGFEKLTAADTIGLMLADLGIDLGVPTVLGGLAAFSKSKRANGPQCVTRFRNSVVHPPTRHRAESVGPSAAIVDARDLALFYLEQTLLRTLGYEALVRHRLYGWGHGLGTTAGT